MKDHVDCQNRCGGKNKDMRGISRLEMLAIQTLTYKCSEKNLCCQSGKIFSHDQYMKHMNDHKTGKVPEDCPNKCGEQIAHVDLKNHIIPMKDGVNISVMLD